MKGKQMTNKSKPAATKKAKAKAKLKIQDLKPKKGVKGGLVEGGNTIIKAPIYKRGWDV
jgi:hypothetical protein